MLLRRALPPARQHTARPLPIYEMGSKMLRHRAVFLDRDGTINEEKDYLHRPEEVVIFPEAGPGLKRLQEAGYLLIVVSNQSGVGRGYFTMTEVESVNARVRQDLAAMGVQLAKFYVAPEAPDQPSRGRKPSPEFLFDARQEFGIDLGQSYMIGDKLIDLECGWNAGVKQTLLVRTGYGLKTEQKNADKLGRAVIVDNLSQAADWILK